MIYLEIVYGNEHISFNNRQNGTKSDLFNRLASLNSTCEGTLITRLSAERIRQLNTVMNHIFS